VKNIDIRTLVLVCTITSLIVAIAFGAAAGSRRRLNVAMLCWGFGFLLRVLGFFFIFLRGRIPDFISTPLANTLIVAGTVALLWGINIYAGKPIQWWFGLAWVTASIVLLLLATYAQPNYNVRVLVVSLLLVGVDVGIARGLILTRETGVRPQQISLAILFLASGAAMAVRGFIAITAPAQSSVFESNAASLIAFIDGFILPICATLGLLSTVALKTQIEREKSISDLEVALRRVKALSGLLPICASCKKIRDENGNWNEVESYVSAHSEADFSHSICPDCFSKLYGFRFPDPPPR